MKVRKKMLYIIAMIFTPLLLSGVWLAWFLFAPFPSISTQQRLAMFPQENLQAFLQGTVELSWDQHQIPYIKADHDADAAFVLGLVHGHLRLTQIEALRKVSGGRISEMVPLKIVADVDAGVRALGFGRSVDKTYQNMPTETRLWLDQFVAGLNHYKAQLPAAHVPKDMRLLKLDWREAFTPQDMLMIGKLTGSSPSWFSYFSSLPLSNHPNGKILLKQLRYFGSAGMVSHIPQGSEFAPHPSLVSINNLLMRQSRSGSNSLVIGKEKSATGNALIANDPHLGMTIPNFWVMVGLQTPSYHGVGMMVPGVPAFGFGRTKHIAWGGTNLHGQDSDMVDVSDLPTDAFTTETLHIKRRLLPDRKFTVRISPYGAVLSDLPFMPQIGKDYALAWTGHLSDADELTALLGAMKARNFTEFKQAMQDFATPGQNFLYADNQGNIGQIVGAHIPKRDAAYREKFYLSPEEFDRYWQNILHAGTLPDSYNPKEKFLASANNRPYAGAPEIGYSFPTGFRVARLQQLVGARDDWDVASLQKLQDDSFSAASFSLVQDIVALLQAQDMAEWDAGLRTQAQQLRQYLQDWDGYYRVNSQGAAHFELFYPSFSKALIQQAGKSELFDLLRRSARKQLLLKEILQNMRGGDPAQAEQALQTGIRAWAEYSGKLNHDTLTWGDIHYLKIQHFIGNAPYIGRKYRDSQMPEMPMPGTNHTIFKTGAEEKKGRGQIRSGTQSQHISDMADIDENYFVLLGGQDGFVGSENFFDLAHLWTQRKLVRLPLSAAAVEQHFIHRMILQ